MSLSWNAPYGDVIPAGSYIDYTYVDGVQGHKAGMIPYGSLGGGGSYSHDANGNVTHDGLAGLDLQYNLLNLTKRISSGGTTLADYHYLADGTRAAAERGDGTGVQYRGSLIYAKEADGSLELDCALTSGGRIANDAGTLQVQHFIRDHLGSVRTIVDGSTGDVLETSDYLPFGKRWELTGGQSSQTVTDPTNRWRFSGKETQSFYNPAIPYNDFGARLHDPRTGRWLGVDPMAEKYYANSIFSFCNNNPIFFIDTNGESTSTHTDEEGNIIAVFYDNDFGIYKHKNNTTKEELIKNHSNSNTSAGGEKMGESWQIDSFSAGMDGEGKIDFGSTQLTDIVSEIIDSNPSIMEYAEKAQYKGDWDIKTHVDNGSLLYGKYATPRDAGNFAAGMFSQSKGMLASFAIDFGYGAYNICGNHKGKTAVLCLLVAASSHSLSLMSYIGMHGEDSISKNAQILGKQYYQSNYR